MLILIFFASIFIFSTQESNLACLSEGVAVAPVQSRGSNELVFRQFASPRKSSIFPDEKQKNLYTYPKLRPTNKTINVTTTKHKTAP